MGLKLGDSVSWGDTGIAAGGISADRSDKSNWADVSLAANGH